MERYKFFSTDGYHLVICYKNKITIESFDSKDKLDKRIAGEKNRLPGPNRAEEVAIAKTKDQANKIKKAYQAFEDLDRSSSKELRQKLSKELDEALKDAKLIRI